MPVAVVCGALANKPFNGGEAWVRLSWVLGLRRLGFETYFVEEIGEGACGGGAKFADSPNRAYFDEVVREFGLAGRAVLLFDGGRETVGMDLDSLAGVLAEADVLFNLSGHLKSAELLAGARSKVYVDLDPGFTQAWHADESIKFRLAGHDRYVTVGLNVGRPECPIPACGIDWVPTLPPTLLGEWPAQAPVGGAPRFTTVARWRSPYGSLEIDGREMGLKHHQFRRFLSLPGRAPGAGFELALDIHPDDSRDLDALRGHGWILADPRRVASTPRAFNAYVSGSAAEFSVAQGVYAEARSGWFSDRTAAYLAAGRPALVQETGLGDALPVGEGLLTFSNSEEAVSGVERIVADPASHGHAARRLATEYLDSDVVLGRLLCKLGIGG
jgi:hypothetical protein